jgi:hypothetical protein
MRLNKYTKVRLETKGNLARNWLLVRENLKSSWTLTLYLEVIRAMPARRRDWVKTEFNYFDKNVQV